MDSLASGSYREIRKALPFVKLVQVIHVVDQSSVDEALQLAAEVDAILLDSGNPHLQIKELGGTGRVHDWTLSQQIRKRLDIPVFLAGGLKPENVQEAIRVVQPFGVDLCSGVRTNGQLDEDKLKRFVAAVNAS